MIRKTVSQVAFAFLALLSVAACAQQTYTSIQANVNIGEPERVIFVFDVPNQPGPTELILQCDFQRAWLITNFGVYGGTKSSNVFPITCTSTGPKAFVLNGTPFTENLTMTGGSQLTLTINSAAWQLVACRQSRWGCPVGSSQITY